MPIKSESNFYQTVSIEVDGRTEGKRTYDERVHGNDENTAYDMAVVLSLALEHLSSDDLSDLEKFIHSKIKDKNP